MQTGILISMNKKSASSRLRKTAQQLCAGMIGLRTTESSGLLLGWGAIALRRRAEDIGAQLISRYPSVCSQLNRNTTFGGHHYPFQSPFEYRLRGNWWREKHANTS